MRKIAFAENEYYHIYNRGVDKRTVFEDGKDFERFLLAMKLLNNERDGLMIRWRDYKNTVADANIDTFLTLNVRKEKGLVDIIAFCLNPNHYHFILKQKENADGIKIFMQRLGNSYTKYFNERNKRNGALFQGRFKSTHIKSTSQLLRMSVYVNCNSEIHGLHCARDYKWCGLPEYLGEREGLCRKNVVMSHFAGAEKYLEYAEKNIGEFKEQKEDEKKLFLE